MNNYDFKLYIQNCSRWLSHAWLIGALFRAGRKVYAGALYEFLYLSVWSILPFALGALVLYVTTDSQVKSFYEFGRATYQNGELLVFTISMLAPILYLTLHEPEQAESFPHKLPISTTVAIIVVTSAVLFALLKAQAVKDLSFVTDLSVILTVIALVFRYLALVYHRLRMPQVSERDLRSPQDEFVEQYRRHVGEDASQAETFTGSFERHLGGQQ